QAKQPDVPWAFPKRASSRSFRFGRLFDGTLLHLECERRQDHKNTHYSFHLEYTTGGSDHNRPTSSSVAFWKNTGCHPLCRPKNGLFISVRNHHSFRRSMNDGRLFSSRGRCIRSTGRAAR